MLMEAWLTGKRGTYDRGQNTVLIEWSQLVIPNACECPLLNSLIWGQ